MCSGHVMHAGCHACSLFSEGRPADPSATVLDSPVLSRNPERVEAIAGISPGVEEPDPFLLFYGEVTDLRRPTASSIRVSNPARSDVSRFLSRTNGRLCREEELNLCLWVFRPALYRLSYQGI